MEYSERSLHIGGVSAAFLIAEFGSPLYVYDAALIRRQIDAVRDAFSELNPTILYAMKANANLAVLHLVLESGLSCDAVSPGEVFLAHRAGFTGKSIWFTCSSVTDEDLVALDDPEIVINVNALDDIDRCIRLKLPNPISLRVNPEIGAGHHPDVVTAGHGVKFGIDLAEATAAIGLAESGGLSVVGLHAHIGSGVSSPDPLIESASQLLELASEVPEIRYVNFGGGLSIPYRPGEKAFPLKEYARRLALLMRERSTGRELHALLEPGRYLVAESGVLLTTVTTRRISAGMEWLGCDSGFNHLVRPSKYGSYHHIVNASDGDDLMLKENAHPIGDGEGVVVAGNLCESGDVFTRDMEAVRPRTGLKARRGDILAICDAGAYGFSMGSIYNARPLPAEVMIDGGTATLIRRRQTFADLLNGIVEE